MRMLLIFGGCVVLSFIDLYFLFTDKISILIFLRNQIIIIILYIGACFYDCKKEDNEV